MKNFEFFKDIEDDKQKNSRFFIKIAIIVIILLLGILLFAVITKCVEKYKFEKDLAEFRKKLYTPISAPIENYYTHNIRFDSEKPVLGFWESNWKPMRINLNTLDVEVIPNETYKEWVTKIHDQECDTFYSISCPIDTSYLRKGYEKYYLGYYNDALNDFDTYIKLYPNSYKGYIAKALLLQRMHRWFIDDSDVLFKEIPSKSVSEFLKVGLKTTILEATISDPDFKEVYYNYKKAFDIISSIGKYQYKTGDGKIKTIDHYHTQGQICLNGLLILQDSVVLDLIRSSKIIVPFEGKDFPYTSKLELSGTHVNDINNIKEKFKENIIRTYVETFTNKYYLIALDESVDYAYLMNKFSLSIKNQLNFWEIIPSNSVENIDCIIDKMKELAYLGIVEFMHKGNKDISQEPRSIHTKLKEVNPFFAPYYINELNAMSYESRVGVSKLNDKKWKIFKKLECAKAVEVAEDKEFIKNVCTDDSFEGAISYRYSLDKETFEPVKIILTHKVVLPNVLVSVDEFPELKAISKGSKKVRASELFLPVREWIKQTHL